MHKNAHLNKRKQQYGYTILILAMLILPLGLVCYKSYMLDYSIADMFPVLSYRVDVTMQATAHGDDIYLSTYLPQSNNHQRISNIVNNTQLLEFKNEVGGLNTLGTWFGDRVKGNHEIQYSFDVNSSRLEYVLPSNLSIPATYPVSLEQYLKEEEGIQSQHELILAELATIIPNKDIPLSQALKKIHNHIQHNFENKNFSGFTDALTALKLREASCNGKGRLFLAMARAMNIPSRLVGGVIMESGRKRTSHQWVEAYVNGHWVPFDTLNDHFATLPANYLTLYYGDQVLFKHTANINFNYNFNIKKKLTPRVEAQDKLADSFLNIVNLYDNFERVGISPDLLKVILMIPLGAVVIVIFRNVVGIPTFGTFLPALIAAAARETGLLWGIIGFIAIIILAAALRRLLDWLQLLHSPKMAIMLTAVVVIMMVITIIGVNTGMFQLAHISLFPIAILAITAERFAQIIEEQSLRDALKLMATSLVVICAAYIVMDSLLLQSLILAFPELLLIVIALNLWLGKWVGLRLTEFFRFRKLLIAEKAI